MKLMVLLRWLVVFSYGVANALRAPLLSARKLHQNMTDLKNGAVLDVIIGGPAINASLPMAIDVSIHGNASVGLGEPDVSYIYIIDTSDSTFAEDGDCGTVLDCVQDFFKELHNESISDGSAELASVINFDDSATVSASLLDPGSPEIQVAFEVGVWGGGTNCSAALYAAAALVESPSNTAGTTVVVFAGDGLCNDDATEVSSSAKALGATGAIVHTVAVGDEVDCDMSQGEVNNMVDIPQNGGTCTSVLPGELPHIIDGLIGTNITSLELKVDGSNFTDINSTSLSHSLPREGAIAIDFNTSVPGLAAGTHEVCVRVTGEDVLGGREQVVDCHEFVVVQDATGGELQGWQIFIIVALSLSFVLLLGYGYRRYRTGKETSHLPSKESDKVGENPPIV